MKCLVYDEYTASDDVKFANVPYVFDVGCLCVRAECVVKYVLHTQDNYSWSRLPDCRRKNCVDGGVVPVSGGVLW